MKQRLLQLLASGVLFFVVISGCIYWLLFSWEDAFLTVLAPTGANDTVPVYAQFSVKQRVQLPTRESVTSITVPFLWQGSNKGVFISLYREEEYKPFIQWYYMPEKPSEIYGRVEPRFMFDHPLWLEGTIDIVISASRISVAESARAPRLFVEKDDGKYPGGNYSIADRQKQGDIGLTLWRLEGHAQGIQEQWSRAKFIVIKKAAYGLLILLLVMSLPYLFTSKKTMNSTTEVVTVEKIPRRRSGGSDEGTSLPA